MNINRNHPFASPGIYRAIFEHTGTAMLMYDEDGLILMVNRELTHLLGYDKHEMEGKRRWMEFVYDEDRERMSDYDHRRRAGDKSVPDAYEYQYVCRDGSRRRGSVTVGHIPNSAISIASVIDITERYELLEESQHLADAMRKSEDSMKLAQRIAHLGNWDWDIPNNGLLWSDEIFRIFGLKPAKKGVSFRTFLQAVHPDDRKSVNGDIQTSLKTGKSRKREFRIRRPDGSERYMRAETGVICNEKGNPVRMIGTVLDITEKKLAEIERDRQKTRLDYLAMHDPLTDLPNRTFLLRELGNKSETQTEQKPFGLICIDIDRFKAINETLGHHAGDRILQKVAERLSLAAGETDSLAHLGGDVFALLMRSPADPGYYARKARDIQQLFSTPLETESFSTDIEISLGIGLYPDQGAGSIKSLLQRAEVAMHAAQRAHSPFLFYEPEMEQFSIEHLVMASALKNAVTNDELILYYQPQIEIRSGRITGVESLLRWNHPQMGVIGPNVFIPMAEQTGLIHPLTQWVANEAFRNQRRWRKQGIDLLISINLAAPNLQDIMLPDDLERLAKDVNISPSGIVLEITERMLMADPRRSIRALTRLKDMGFKLSIDDFGTGYSSLAYLKDIPVDELKIDISFVEGITKNEKKLMIVRTIIDLAHNLGCKVIAEGVESDEQWQLLKELSCDIVQGFLISHPVSSGNLVQWLKKRKP